MIIYYYFRTSSPPSSIDLILGHVPQLPLMAGLHTKHCSWVNPFGCFFGGARQPQRSRFNPSAAVNHLDSKKRVARYLRVTLFGLTPRVNQCRFRAPLLYELLKPEKLTNQSERHVKYKIMPAVAGHFLLNLRDVVLADLGPARRWRGEIPRLGLG